MFVWSFLFSFNANNASPFCLGQKSHLTWGGLAVTGPNGHGKFILFIRWSTCLMWSTCTGSCVWGVYKPYISTRDTHYLTPAYRYKDQGGIAASVWNTSATKVLKQVAPVENPGQLGSRGNVVVLVKLVPQVKIKKTNVHVWSLGAWMFRN